MSATPPHERNWSDLRARIISAVVMAVLCFSLVYSGVYGTAVLAFVGSCIMLWEWSRMTTKGQTRGSFLEIACGSLIIVAACIAFLWLRGDVGFGLLTTIWLPFTVIAADVGAYFSGRAFGVPKLAPKISPNKTVSGALGGIALAIAVGVAVAVIGGAGTVWIIAVLSLLIAMISQVGDLTESSAKRRYGVKDTSNILPGHGGMLDRFDGLIAATIFVALLELVAGSSVFTW